MNIIFDLDGTLAITDHRQHFIDRASHATPDWDAFFAACDQDLPNIPVIKLYEILSKTCHNTVIWSGRSDAVREKTVSWLYRHVPGFLGTGLRMRQAGDFTPDQELKRNWLMEEADKGWVPDLVFDDRDKVVKMWRDNGITCAQVAEGSF